MVEAMPNFYNILRARKFSTAADTALEISPSGSATPNFVIEAGRKTEMVFWFCQPRHHTV